MKTATAILALLLAVLQYRLWFGDGGAMERRQLGRHVADLQQQLRQSRERNQALEAEVQDLKHDLSAIEERARRDLGMIKKGETYVMMVEQP